MSYKLYRSIINTMTRWRLVLMPNVLRDTRVCSRKQWFDYYLALPLEISTHCVSFNCIVQQYVVEIYICIYLLHPPTTQVVRGEITRST